MPFLAPAAPWIIGGLGIAGLATQLVGQYKQGQAAEAQTESEQAWHEYNAKLAEREATEAQEAAAYEEKKLRKSGERFKARQRMLYAKAGVSLEGSPLEVMEETATELEMDALMIRRGGQLGYQRYSAEAGLERMAGKSALLRGRSARRASRWKMAGTGLIGGSQLFSMLPGGGSKYKYSGRGMASPWQYSRHF